MPEVDGLIPLMMADLEGPQAGAAQCALVNTIALDASFSIWGVLDWGLPPSTPFQSFISSTAMKRTFGFDGLTAGGFVSLAQHKVQLSKTDNKSMDVFIYKVLLFILLIILICYFYSGWRL